MKNKMWWTWRKWRPESLNITVQSKLFFLEVAG